MSLGNPGLEPEEVTSIDVSAEWYFAPSALVSVGWFTKDRTNIFGSDFEGALLIDDGMGGFLRETDPTCPGGGIFNPDVIPNVLGDPNTTGLCVDFSRPGNDPATTTQSGWEFAFQYDLSSFEDRLGWASGFGVVANYTKQEFEGGSVVDTTSGRGLTVLGDLSIPRGLLDFSETPITQRFTTKSTASRLAHDTHGVKASEHKTSVAVQTPAVAVRLASRFTLWTAGN